MQRFWSKATGRNKRGCWLWTASKNAKGYGRFNLNGNTQAAHRVAYELFFGPIPNGLFVCHFCDNPACVNPSHLWLGTNSDNIRDSVNKGRFIATGSRNGRAILTDRDVLAIRSSAKEAKVLASCYGVSIATIRHARNGRSWRHI